MKGTSATEEQTAVFLRLLLISGLYVPPGRADTTIQIREIVRQYGITLHSSEFEIIERTTVGTSFILIARYSLDYSFDNNPGGERVCIEGAVAAQFDGTGNIIIKILSNPNPFQTFFRPGQHGVSGIREKI